MIQVNMPAMRNALRCESSKLQPTPYPNDIALQLTGRAELKDVLDTITQHARDLLAKGCTLDLHPDEFKAGECAQTGLAKANVLIARIAAPEGFELLVRRTFADYLVQWLHHAGREFEIDFAQQ